jgi:hypothetical protein
MGGIIEKIFEGSVTEMKILRIIYNPCTINIIKPDFLYN